MTNDGERLGLLTAVIPHTAEFLNTIYAAHTIGSFPKVLEICGDTRFGGWPCPILSAQSKKEYNPEVIEKIVASGDYKINVGTYMPPSGEYIELDYPENSIEIKNDSVFSDLFFVEESDIPYSGRGNELRFQVPLKKYTMDIDRKGNTHINFSVRTKVDKFNFKVVVYFDGRAIVNVFMQHHQSVSFLGELNI